MNKNDYLSLLPKRPQEIHKNQCGKVAIIAGSLNYLGAALLACKASLRTGSGLVYLLTIPSIGSFIQAQCPEIIFLPLNETKGGGIDSSSTLLIKNYLKRYKIDVCCIGPGLGLNEDIRSLVRQSIKISQNLSIPIVLDADGLNAVDMNFLAELSRYQIVLTPHVGEFKQLFSNFSNLVSDHENRKNICKMGASKLNQILVLKGHKTVISDGLNNCINQTGNSGLASAGMGDVLSGMIASFIGQGLSLYNSAVLATFMHGLAADLIYKTRDVSMLASDVVESISNAYFFLKGHDHD